ncbi:response regulator transcription factor [Chitinibacteraceae bacterium HSL-7]
MQILLIEDDPILGDGIREGLRDAGYAVEWLQDGQAGWLTLDGPHSFDAVVLDINLPRMDGLTLLARLRQVGDVTPVLLLTARDLVDDRIRGLESGADDYLVKPFVLGELVARLRALLRRAHGMASNRLRWRALEVDGASQHASWQGLPLNLTATEFRLLHLLMLNRPHYLSRVQLEEKLFGWQHDNESNSLDVHLSHLRKKLGPDVIENQRGLGWRLGDE